MAWTACCLLPVEGDAVSCICVDVGFACSGALVADYVGAAYGGGLDESVVLVKCVPTCGHGPGALGVVVPHWVSAGGPSLTIDSDAADVAVGFNNSGGKRENSGGEGKEGS